MNIRLAAAAEAALLAGLDQTSVFSAHWTVTGWQDELANPACRVWCAEINGKIVGFIALRGAADQYEITNLAVATDLRRQGIGRTLLTHALAQLPGGDVTLEVSVKNVPAVCLYEQTGFARRGVRNRFYQDGSDALVMGQRL